MYEGSGSFLENGPSFLRDLCRTRSGSRNPVKPSPTDLDARFREHDEKNTPTSQLFCFEKVLLP